MHTPIPLTTASFHMNAWQHTQTWTWMRLWPSEVGNNAMSQLHRGRMLHNVNETMAWHTWCSVCLQQCDSPNRFLVVSNGLLAAGAVEDDDVSAAPGLQGAQSNWTRIICPMEACAGSAMWFELAKRRHSLSAAAVTIQNNYNCGPWPGLIIKELLGNYQRHHVSMILRFSGRKTVLRR